jgi:hypothetical protein
VDAVEVGEIEKTLLGSDNNVFYNPDIDLAAYRVCKHNIDDWKNFMGMNYDTNSLFGVNPDFVDPDNGDFRFQANSPAHDLGIIQSDAATSDGVGPVDFPEFSAGLPLSSQEIIDQNDLPGTSLAIYPNPA